MLAIACVLVLLAAVAGTPVAGGVTDDTVDLDGALEETVDENPTDVDDEKDEAASEETGDDVPDAEPTTNETPGSEETAGNGEQDGNLVEQTTNEVNETLDETVPHEGTENDTDREEDSDETSEDTEEDERQDGEADDAPDEEDPSVLEGSETDELLNETTDTVAEADPVEETINETEEALEASGDPDEEDTAVLDEVETDEVLNETTEVVEDANPVEETINETEEALEPNDDSDEEDAGVPDVSESNELLNETTDVVEEVDPVEDTLEETEEALDADDDSNEEDDALLEISETDELLNETTENVEEIEPIEETTNETDALTAPVDAAVNDSATVDEIEESLETATNDPSLTDLTENVTDPNDGLTGAVESDLADATNATADGLVNETLQESDATDLLEEDRSADLLENATREPLEGVQEVEDESPLPTLLENESDDALLDATMLDDDGIALVENETILGTLLDGERDELLAIDGVEVAGVEANLSVDGELSDMPDDLLQGESIYGLVTDDELLADEERALDLELVVLGEEVDEDVLATLLEEDLVVVTGPDGDLVLLDRRLESDGLLEDEFLGTLLQETDGQLETLLGEEGLSGSLESGLAVLDRDDGGLQVVHLLVDDTVSSVIETTDVADLEELVTALDEDLVEATEERDSREIQTTEGGFVTQDVAHDEDAAVTSASVPTERSEPTASDSLVETSERAPSESEPTDERTSPLGAIPAPIRLRDAAVLGAVGAGSAALGTAILAGQGASATGSMAPALGLRAEALSSRLRIPRLPLFPGYQRHDETDPLENEVRAAMYEAIESRPGIHVSALADDLDVSRSTVRYHQRILEYENLITSEKIRGRRRVFPVGRDDLAIATVQAEDTRADVLHVIANQEPVSISRVADALECDVSTISYHVGRLEEDALIEREADGARVHLTLSPRSRAVLEPSNDGAVAQLD